MVNIPVNGLIDLFRRMYREHWAYDWGAARAGCVDCSGAFVWAFEQYHKVIPHGSNSMARGSVRELLPISEARDGMAAFKLRKPGEKGYDLPERFRGGPNLNDYYHVGLIDGGRVLNAQSKATGFVSSPLTGWEACGYLKAVDYGREAAPMEPMIVTSDNGFPVKVRVNPNKESARVDTLDVGTPVQAGEDCNGWRQITYGTDGAGYMMSQFLKPATVATDTDMAPAPSYVRTLTPDEYNRLCEARDQIAAALDTVKSIVGVG